MKEKWEQNFHLDDQNIRKMMRIKMRLEKVESSQGKNAVFYKCECGKIFEVGLHSYLPICFFAGCNYCVHTPIKEKRLYKIWAGMKNRCSNPKNAYYNFYGGKGIKVCKSWLEYRCFEAWALNHGYSDGMTIERIDINGNYSPKNCKWIPMEEQSKNRSTTYQNRFFTYGDETLNYYQWAEKLNVTPQEISRRVRKHGQNNRYVISPPAPQENLTRKDSANPVRKCFYR